MKIKYIENYEDLIKYLIFFSELPIKPCIFVIDDISSYFSW